MRTSTLTLAAVVAAVLLSPPCWSRRSPRSTARSPSRSASSNSPPGEITCDIWVMNPDGSDPTNLTNTPELNEMLPAWSPDGTRIAYVEGTNFVYTIRS